MSDSSASVQTRSSLPQWREWVASVFLLLLAFGFFVVRPALDRLGRSLGGLAVVAAAQVASVLGHTHATACQSIEQDPSVHMLLGGSVTCAPVEDVTWHQPRDSELLEWEFAITSDTGRQGTAVAVARILTDGPALESIIVSGEDGSVLLLPLP
jgi:hypothetical protein